MDRRYRVFMDRRYRVFMDRRYRVFMDMRYRVFMDMTHFSFIHSKGDVRVFSLRRLNIYGQSVLVASTDYFATFFSIPFQA
jgi:hypothetical protein